MTAAIDHVELFVPDRRQTAEWYRRVLGLDVVPEFEHWAEDPRGPLMIGSAAGTKLALFEGEPPGKRGTIGFRRVAFRLQGADFLDFLARLEALGLAGGAGPLRPSDAVDHGAAFSLYFRDPWGHPLEVTVYEELERVREACR